MSIARRVRGREAIRKTKLLFCFADGDASTGHPLYSSRVSGGSRALQERGEPPRGGLRSMVQSGPQTIQWVTPIGIHRSPPLRYWMRRSRAGWPGDVPACSRVIP